jgi:hypothetical protein
MTLMVEAEHKANVGVGRCRRRALRTPGAEAQRRPGAALRLAALACLRADGKRSGLLRWEQSAIAVCPIKTCINS